MLDTVHPACREFVQVVEALLERCRTRAQEGAPASPGWYHDNWWARTWTRSEFEDAVYSSYKPMRQGRVTRPPRREIVMEIADYLNCTLEERNRLLLAAQATPIAPYLTGERLAQAVQLAEAITQYLPLPALILKRDWHIHGINPH